MTSGMTTTFDGYQHILLPIDFTEHCDRTARHAAWLARHSGAMVHLAHVVENPLDPIYTPEEVQHWVVVDHANAKARELLEEVARTCLPKEVQRTLHILGGDPAEKLVALAESIPADLVVMSTQGSSIAHLLLGDIAEKVSRHAHCPVLLVRVPRE
jgi:nucleotide-binding universal stress UspA family protein